MRVARVRYRDAVYTALLNTEDSFQLLPEAGLEPIALIAEAGWESLAEQAAVEVRREDAELLAPIGRPGKIVCVGLNYWDHATEQGLEAPKTPVLFAKMPTAVIGPGTPIPIHPVASELDYEAELAVVIGKRVRDISAAEVTDAIAGYTIVNDVSARDLQRIDGQWVRAKSLDGYAPMGPVLVSRDEIDDPGSLDILCYVNHELRQKSNTRNLIFDVATLISFCAQGMTLEPGDVICTGTPGGVGAFMTPATYLKLGDVVRVYVEQIGELTNPVGRG